MTHGTTHLRLLTALVLTVLTGSLLRGQDYMEDMRGEANPISLRSSGDLFLRLNTSDESIKMGFFRFLPVWDNNNPDTLTPDQRVLRQRCQDSLAVLRTRIDEAHRVMDSCVKEAFPQRPCQETLVKKLIEHLGSDEAVVSDPSICDPSTTTTGTEGWLGVGAYVKSAASDGIATLLTGGDLSIGNRISAYLAYRQTRVEKDDLRYAWWVVPSIAYEESSFDLARPLATGEYQYSDTILKANDIGLSFVLTKFIGKTNSSGFRPDQFYVAASISLAEPNDYASLAKVKTQQFTTRTDTTNGQSTTTETAVQDQKTYGLGTVNKLEETRVRLNVAYIPESWGRRFALNLYPSLNLREHVEPRFDIGFSINLLKKDDRTLAIGGLTFEFVDVSNTGKSTVPFMTRCLTIGLNAGLSIDGILKKG